MKEERKKMEDIAKMMLEEKCYYENAYIVGHEEGEKRGISIGEKRGISIGEKRGILIGEKRGISQEKESIALNMLKENLDINLISKLTNLSKNKILSLK